MFPFAGRSALSEVPVAHALILDEDSGKLSANTRSKNNVRLWENTVRNWTSFDSRIAPVKPQSGIADRISDTHASLSRTLGLPARTATRATVSGERFSEHLRRGRQSAQN